MGPPLKAAENQTLLLIKLVMLLGFNGAAAKSSGKYNCHNSDQFPGAASMGPPLKAAENVPSVQQDPRWLRELQWGRR